MLRRICLKENIEAEFEALERIACNSRGDMRSAINDLQSAAAGKKTFRVQDTILLGSRNKDATIYEVLKGVFSAESVKEAATLINQSNIDYDEFLLSVSDNLPFRYANPIELAVAYGIVSKADVFRGRVGIENWRLLKYFFNLLAEAVTVSTKSFKPFEFKFPPMRIMTLFWTKHKRAKLEVICAKIALKCHVSHATAKNDMIPFIKIILEKEKSTPIINWLKLEPDEVEYLTNMKKL